MIKLRDYLAVTPSDMSISIGSTSSYLFCGTKSLFMKDCAGLQGFMFFTGVRLLNDAQHIKNKRDRENAIARRTAYIKDFVPLLEREVLETYTRFDGADAIIIEGTETGDCWDAKEYSEWRKTWAKDTSA